MINININTLKPENNFIDHTQIFSSSLKDLTVFRTSLQEAYTLSSHLRFVGVFSFSVVALYLRKSQLSQPSMLTSVYVSVRQRRRRHGGGSAWWRSCGQCPQILSLCRQRWCHSASSTSSPCQTMGHHELHNHGSNNNKGQRTRHMLSTLSSHSSMHRPNHTHTSTTVGYITALNADSMFSVYAQKES